MDDQLEVQEVQVHCSGKYLVPVEPVRRKLKRETDFDSTGMDIVGRTA